MMTEIETDFFASFKGVYHKDVSETEKLLNFDEPEVHDEHFLDAIFSPKMSVQAAYSMFNIMLRRTKNFNPYQNYVRKTRTGDHSNLSLQQIHAQGSHQKVQITRTNTSKNLIKYIFEIILKICIVERFGQVNEHKMAILFRKVTTFFQNYKKITE